MASLGAGVSMVEVGLPVRAVVSAVEIEAGSSFVMPGSAPIEESEEDEEDSVAMEAGAG